MSQMFASLFIGSAIRRLEAGEFLFLVEDEVASIFRVATGSVALRRVTPDGTELLLQTARCGDVLAEASAYSDRYHCDALALEPSEVEVIGRSEFRRALISHPDLAEIWAERLAHAVQGARMRAELRTLRTVAERLDGWLSANREIPPKGNWQDLAERPEKETHCAKRALRETQWSALCSADRTCSISSDVVPRPRLNRMAPIPISGLTSMASRTGHSSTRPE